MSLADKIAALPKPPIATPDEIFERCTQYALMRLPGQPFGIHMGTSYLISDLQMSLRAALARLALYNELARAGDVRLVMHTEECGRIEGHKPCICGRDALLKSMEVPRG